MHYSSLAPVPLKAFKAVDFNYMNIFNKIPFLTAGKTVREETIISGSLSLTE